MANMTYNISLGQVVTYYNNVDANTPGTATLDIVAIAIGSTTEAQEKDFDTLAACLPGAGGAAEVTNSGYARKQLSDTDLVAFTVDDTNDWIQLTFPDQTWTSVAAGSVWSDLIIAYNPTQGADSTKIPLTRHDFVVTPDGSNIIATVGANGFVRIS